MDGSAGGLLSLSAERGDEVLELSVVECMGGVGGSLRKAKGELDPSVVGGSLKKIEGELVSCVVGGLGASETDSSFRSLCEAWVAALGSGH